MFQITSKGQGGNEAFKIWISSDLTFSNLLVASESELYWVFDLRLSLLLKPISLHVIGLDIVPLFLLGKT